MELSLVKNVPHVPLSVEVSLDQSLQLSPEKVPSDLVPVQNPNSPVESLSAITSASWRLMSIFPSHKLSHDEEILCP